MRKNWILKVAFSAVALFGASSVNAQKGYEVPPISDELATTADQVIDLQLSDPDKANMLFTKLLRKVKNNKENLLSVGQYFLDKNVYPCANQCAKELYTLDPLYIPGLMYNGEVCMLRKDYGSAGQKFDEVLNIDSTYVPALKRNAFVYKNVNPHVAIEMIERIKRIEPDNAVADRDLGDIYYNLEEYKDAVKSYKTYFKSVTANDSSDIRPAENYLMSLYSTQSFMDITSLADRFIALDGQDMVFKRLKFFAAVENYELDDAKTAMSYITEQEYPDSFYLYLDYAYAGNLMDELSDSDPSALAEAISYYKKALERDSTKVQGYKKLATLYRRNKQNEEGIVTYKKYVDALGDKAQLSDLFGLGQQYLAASQQNGLSADKKAEYVAAGDAIFADIQAKKPDSYQAVLMRAAINITDGSKPEEKVKNYYQEALKLMEGKEDVGSAKVQALRYLAFCAVQEDQLDAARKYCNDIIAIDADNAFAKQIDAYLKSEGK
jgi:tetratricopeptide (TPR) repeat protein